jgi:hypothetical protein
MNIWAKRDKIEQVRQHRILGLTFDTRINWLEHIKNIKARAEKNTNKIKYLAHTTWGADQESLLKVHQMIVLSALRYRKEAYRSATEAVLTKLELTHNRGIRLALGAFAVSRTENVLCEAGMTFAPTCPNLMNRRPSNLYLSKLI